MRFKTWLILCVLIFSGLFPASIFARDVPATTKKDVVKNYKLNLNDYLTFGTDCSLKPRGDANCDKVINQFDLSIWEVEFNTPSNPRRSDFNNDGQVNLVDFGIWRNTFYPATKVTQAKPEFLIDLIDLISKKAPITKFGNWYFEYYLGQLEIRSIRNFLADVSNWIPAFTGMTVTAQESQPNTQPLDGSLALVSGSGNSQIINSQSTNSQQVNFNSEGDALSSQVYGTNGQLLAGIKFLESGTTIVSTQQDGVLIQTNKTGTGAVIEFYNNPDGSLIATKSWPTQASYDSKQPPTAVTLPGKAPNTFLTLNIQPNGGGVLQEFDNQGNILTQSQISANGFFITSNSDNTVTQSNPNIGFASLGIPNKIGGKTNYLFFKNTLTTITQTDSKNNFWQAIQNSDGTWDMVGIVNGQEEKKTVADPVAELKSGTIRPVDLLNSWNYYTKSAKQGNDSVDFATSFNSNSSILKAQVAKADQAYAINQVTPQNNILGIVKEVHAQQPAPDWTSQNPAESNRVGGHSISAQVDSRADGGSSTGQTTVVSVIDNVHTTPAGQPNLNPEVSQAGNVQIVVPASFEVPDLAGKTPQEALSAIDSALSAAGATPTGNAGRGFGDTASNSTSNTTLDNIRNSLPTSAPPQQQPQVVPAVPGALVVTAPAAPPAPPPPPNTAPSGPAGAGLPSGWTSNTGPAGSINGVSFTQTYDPKTGDITANFPSTGNVQVTHTRGVDFQNMPVNTVEYSYGSGVFNGITVSIAPTTGFVTDFTFDGKHYTIQGTSIFEGANRVTDSNVVAQAAGLVAVNNAANELNQDIWSPPSLDAPWDQTGASPDDPGTSYTDAIDAQGNPTHPDMVQGPNGPEPGPTQPDFGGPTIGDPGIAGGEFGGSTGSDFNQPAGGFGDQPSNGSGNDQGTDTGSGPGTGDTGNGDTGDGSTGGGE